VHRSRDPQYRHLGPERAAPGMPAWRRRGAGPSRADRGAGLLGRRRRKPAPCTSQIRLHRRNCRPFDRVGVLGRPGQTGEDGFLYFVGSVTKQIKSDGYRVSPHEVEDILSGLPPWPKRPCSVKRMERQAIRSWRSWLSSRGSRAHRRKSKRGACSEPLTTWYQKSFTSLPSCRAPPLARSTGAR